MFSPPTLKSTVFWVVAYALALALLLAGAGGPGLAVALGGAALLGLMSGQAHELALRQMPGRLTPASADTLARRQAFMASGAGRLHVGIDLGVWLTSLAVAVIVPTWPWPPLAFALAYAVMRHAVVLPRLVRDR